MLNEDEDVDIFRAPPSVVIVVVKVLKHMATLWYDSDIQVFFFTLGIFRVK